MIILVWIAGAIYQSAYNKGRSDQAALMAQRIDKFLEGLK